MNFELFLNAEKKNNNLWMYQQSKTNINMSVPELEMKEERLSMSSPRGNQVLFWLE